MTDGKIEPKPISKDGIKAALKKAERYRLLNDPIEAESICRDVLRIEPDNQAALIDYLLSLTDQFPSGLGPRHERAWEIVGKLKGKYNQAYYAGIICERRAKTALHQHAPHSRYIAYHWLREAMEYYEKAEKTRPKNCDAAILRWNACVRILNDHSELEPAPKESGVERFGE